MLLLKMRRASRSRRLDDTNVKLRRASDTHRQFLSLVGVCLHIADDGGCLVQIAILAVDYLL